MKNIRNIRSFILTIAAMVIGLVITQRADATPYASCLTNNAGTIQFYLNESNATICVTYEDGSTNANFDGINTGTNLLKGLKTFSLGAHSSYTITVTKNGSGSSSLLATYPINNAGGVDVNKTPNSRFFGQVYAASRGAGIEFAATLCGHERQWHEWRRGGLDHQHQRALPLGSE
jgi:hypothetical protein